MCAKAHPTLETLSWRKELKTECTVYPVNHEQAKNVT